MQSNCTHCPETSPQIQLLIRLSEDTDTQCSLARGAYLVTPLYLETPLVKPLLFRLSLARYSSRVTRCILSRSCLYVSTCIYDSLISLSTTLNKISNPRSSSSSTETNQDRQEGLSLNLLGSWGARSLSPSTWAPRDHGCELLPPVSCKILRWNTRSRMILTHVYAAVVPQCDAFEHMFFFFFFWELLSICFGRMHGDKDIKRAFHFTKALLLFLLSCFPLKEGRRWLQNSKFEN